MARIEKTIFISYRRKDISWALAVYQYLTSQKYDVFFDYTSIPSGDFEQIIVSNIKARAHFVLILTPTALDRCSQPGDWLRREIETAVDEKRNIIPLLFDGFNFASPSVIEKLTGKLAAIPRYNALEIPSGYFIEAMERLSRRYLNIPLDAVIHPVSTEVRKVVKEEQIAVNDALVQKWDDLKELFKPAEEKSVEEGQAQIETAAEASSPSRRWIENGSQRANLRLYVIGVSILLVVALVLAGINAWVNAEPEATFTPAPPAIGADWINGCISALWKPWPDTIPTIANNGCLSEPVSQFFAADGRLTLLVNGRFPDAQVYGMFAPLSANGIVRIDSFLRNLQDGEIWIGIFAEPTVESQGMILVIPPGDVNKRLLIQKTMPGQIELQRTQSFQQNPPIYDVVFDINNGAVSATILRDTVFNSPPLNSAQPWLFVGYQVKTGDNVIDAEFLNLVVQPR